MPTLDTVIPCFNSGTSLYRTLEEVLNQNLGENWQLKVIAIDDASTDNSFANLPQEIRKSIQIVRLEENKGRAIARNTGAHSGRGDYIVFLDSDCEPQFQNCFQLLIEKLENGYDVISGSIQARGSGFWVDYFNEISSNREKITKSGSLEGFTSPYFVLSRRYFELCGGFDDSYLSYGFEDRDFILRLRDAGASIGFVSESIVFHEEVESIFTVTNKLKEAGQFSSIIFERSHPDIYRNMKYGRIDARIHPYKMKFVVLFLTPFLSTYIRIGNKIINQKYAPYFLKVFCVKLLSALSYIKGTSIAAKSI